MTAPFWSGAFKHQAYGFSLPLQYKYLCCFYWCLFLLLFWCCYYLLESSPHRFWVSAHQVGQKTDFQMNLMEEDGCWGVVSVLLFQVECFGLCRLVLTEGGVTGFRRWWSVRWFRPEPLESRTPAGWSCNWIGSNRVSYDLASWSKGNIRNKTLDRFGRCKFGFIICDSPKCNNLSFRFSSRGRIEGKCGCLKRRSSSAAPSTLPIGHALNCTRDCISD